MTFHVSVQSLTLSYQHKAVFANLNLQLSAGKWVALLGPSGIGKTSLLRAIAGLTTTEETFSGQIEVSNQIPIQQQVAYLAQTDLLLPWLNVFENAVLCLKLRKHIPNEYKQKINLALSLLDQVGLSNETKAYPEQLSGGMRQRVALVRTLLDDKPIVLMDEPFSALDAITRYKLQNLAAQLLKHKTILFITHDPTESLRLAHEIYIMQGNPATLKLATKLQSTTPRELNDIEVMSLQSTLYEALLQSDGTPS